jgi:hypothetical protein
MNDDLRGYGSATVLQAMDQPKILLSISTAFGSDHSLRGLIIFQ